MNSNTSPERAAPATKLRIDTQAVYIPKNETEFRPIGIPAIENKIVERAVVWILERIYEQDFYDCSYGFRPKRNCHQALKLSLIHI